MLLKVDGVNVPCPSSFRTGIMDISKADRVATGRIRAWLGTEDEKVRRGDITI